jgi:hypothetical protein
MKLGGTKWKKLKCNSQRLLKLEIKFNAECTVSIRGPVTHSSADFQCSQDTKRLDMEGSTCEVHFGTPINITPLDNYNQFNSTWSATKLLN